jgi:hypothetical protein
MRSEEEPITDDEWLLRRVHRDKFRTDTAPLDPNAFRPTTSGNCIDVTGISLFREACQQSADDILRLMTPAKRADYGIVKVRVSDLKKLNLSVVRDPVPEIPGHVVIPELNALEYEKCKIKYTPIKRQLAEFANENVVRWPAAQENCRI